jgi:hypothetical protein
VELSQYSSNVTFIFDSCHSGTVSRGDLEARESPPDTRPQPPYKCRFPPTGEDRSQKYVTISAALPNQRAYARPKEIAPVRNGALTYHLVAALRRASRQTTYRALMHEVSQTKFGYRTRRSKATRTASSLEAPHCARNLTSRSLMSAMIR